MSLAQTLHVTVNKVKYTAVIVDEIIPETVHNRLRGDALTSVQQIHDTELSTHVRQWALNSKSHCCSLKRNTRIPLVEVASRKSKNILHARHW